MSTGVVDLLAALANGLGVNDFFVDIKNRLDPPCRDASLHGNVTNYKDPYNNAFNKSVNSVLRSTAESGIEMIPVAGGLLSKIFSAIFGEAGEKGLVWEDIEGKVKEVATELINDNNSRLITNNTGGLSDIMKKYLDPDAGVPEKGQYFTNIVSFLAHDKRTYLTDPVPWKNLASFAAVGTMHLTILREQYLFYKEIYGHEHKNPGKLKEELEGAVKEYLNRRNQIVAKCLKYHSEQIKIHQQVKDSGYFNVNELHYKNPLRGVDEHFRWDDTSSLDRARFRLRQKQWEAWIDTGYRAEIEAALSPSFSWPLYLQAPKPGFVTENPAHVDEGKIDNNTVRRLMMTYPGWMGDGYHSRIGEVDCYFDHEDMFRKHGPVSKIVIHSGDLIDGIELWYGNEQAKRCGGETGYSHQTLELKPGEMFTQLQSTGIDSIFYMKISATTGDGKLAQSIYAGKEKEGTDPWGWSFDGHRGGAQGDQTKRLLYFTGWSSGADFPRIYRLQPVFGHYQTWGPLK